MTATMRAAAVETTMTGATVETAVEAVAPVETAMMEAMMEPADPDEGWAAEIVRIAIVSWVPIPPVTVSVVGIVVVTGVGIAAVVIAICPGTRRKHQADRRELQ
jgi:hypothetical protein